MEDNQAQDHQKHPIKSLSLPPPSSSAPSRKLFIADLKPKHSFTAVAADSSSSTFPKKTRETPNLSNCHGCGLRINYTNPKERLQTLDSLWRIVLLCKKCFKRVESAEICSYCFCRACREVCFRCTGCNRRMHKDCVVKFGRFPPWSYCSSETSFLRCVDCWIPKSLVNSSTRVYRRKKIVDKSVTETDSVGDCRVSLNSEKAKEDVSSKAVGKCVVVIAKDEKNDSCSSEATTSADVNDVDLAFKLHRAINSSRRISKNDCLLNSGCLGVQHSRDSDIEGSSIELGNLIDKRESVMCKQHDMQSQELHCKDSGNLLHVEESNGKPNDRFLLKYSKRRDRCKVTKPDRYMLKYKKRSLMSEADSNTETKSCDDSIYLENKASEQKCDANSNDCHLSKYSENWVDANTIDRYMLKYQKRSIKSKADSDIDSKSCDDSVYLGNLTAEQKCDANSDNCSLLKYSKKDGDANTNDRYLLKYSKKGVRLKQFQSCAVHV